MDEPKLPERSWLKPALWALLSLVLLGLVVWLLYVWPAQRAAAAYERRVNSASLSFDGRLEFYGQDFLSALDSKLDFSGSYSKAPAFAGHAHIDGTWAKKQYEGNAVAKDGRLFFELGGPQLPVVRYKQSLFLLPLRPEWYSAKLDASLFDTICENRIPASPAASLAFYRRLKELRLNPSPWVNFFSYRDGQRGTHFTGHLDQKQLPAFFQALEQALPAGCGLNTIGITPADTASMQVGWDLWANGKTDQLRLTVDDKTLGSRLVFSLNTFEYGRPVRAVPPPAAVDLNQIFAGVKLQY